MSVHSPAHVALIDETGQVSSGDLARYAAALNEQVQSDFGPIWNARAIVAVATFKPVHSWAVRIKTQLDQPGALGYHTDELNQPDAYVELTDTVSVTLSHELLEMLADAWGNRMRQAGLPNGLDPSQVGLTANDLVAYLLEVGDPCESTSYNVLGVPMSDFILPTWYRSFISLGAEYSHAGGCTKPRQVADGGYVSFARQDGTWFQVFNQGGSLQVSDLGKFSQGEGACSLREWVDTKAREYRKGLNGLH